MKKIKIPYKRFICPAISVILLIITILFAYYAVGYNRKTIMSAEKINRYIKEVALEKVNVKEAEEVIANLEGEEVSEPLNTNVANPFKTFEDEKIDLK